MCGGSLEVTEGMTVCECEYCGTQQTLPKTNNDITANLFNRANNLRMKNEFDKAQEIYEKIVSNHSDDSEAYWGIVLCKFGIEYVEDPVTFKKIPTCHRTQLESVLTDVDYYSALEYASQEQKVLYEAEAREIDRLQRDILEIVHKEKPFDVFICYKESDENGKRTQDSVIANDIYHQLVQVGFKVFYAAITLEDKLGQAYEPYIFAALNSAKVMLVIGTKPEYFNAVWVKNEWSRYLKLMKKDRKKMLIPCYKDMDAYDLPEDFSHLQAQDMSKIGFVNDIIRGIKKVITENVSISEDNNSNATPMNANVENLLKRGNLALEDKLWREAGEFFEQVLNENVEEARAYIGKLMVDYQISFEEDIPSIAQDFSGNNNYKKAIRFGKAEYRTKVENYNKQAIYNGAILQMNHSETDTEYRKTRDIFTSISEYSDASEMAEKCEISAKDYIYQKAEEKIKTASLELAWRQLVDAYNSISGYLDADKKCQYCKEKAEEAQQNESMYNPALDLLHSNSIENIEKSIKMLEKISDYRNSSSMIERAKKQLRTLQYREKLQKIEDIRKELYAEMEKLGIFSKKRKSEISHELTKLARDESDLKNEYKDVI